jgi:hypothetical protein
MDLVANSLKLLPLFSLDLVFLLGESVKILLMSLLLLLDTDLDRSKILLEFSLVDTVLVFNILESDLGLFLKIS